MNDTLGDRMKSDYEDRTRILLPRRTNTIIRVDGRAFHTLTRGFQRPFDISLMGWMDAVCEALCAEIPGAKLGFVQSDEASIWVTDYDDPVGTEAWFDANLQKITSVAASIATMAFNKASQTGETKPRLATFDARAFTIPTLEEVVNYFIWRQKDATRNSISMAAQSQFSHKELQGKSSNELQEMLFKEKGINWNDYPDGFKRGRCAVRVKTIGDVEWTDKKTGEVRVQKDVERSKWVIEAPPIFTADRNYIKSRLLGTDSIYVESPD